jgi:uncharacterized repeat protein (TIGR02543 family)
MKGVIMKRIKKFLGMIMVIAIVFSLFPISEAAAVSSDYDADEVSKLQAFFNRDSAVQGMSNGQRLNSAYDSEDPGTWPDIVWTDTNPMHVYSIGLNGSWNGKMLKGTLDLSDFENLNTLYCSNNQINSIMTSGARDIMNIDCTHNPLRELNLRFNYGYAELSTEGYGYIGVKSYHDYETSGLELHAYSVGGSTFDGWWNIEYEEEVKESTSLLYPINIIESSHDYVAVFEGGTFPSITPYPSGSPEPSITPLPTPIPTRYIYTVAFDLNGGTHTGGGSLTQYVLDGDHATAPTTEREGYNFVGWDSEFENPSRDITVKAVWEEKIKIFQVTFDLNNGLRNGGGQIYQEIEDGNAATAPTVMRHGYTFEGWDKAYDKVVEDITVTATWKEIVVEEIKYQVTYDLNGGEGTTPVDEYEYQEGEFATLAEGSGLTKEGYEFAGWSLDQEGEAISETEITIDEDVTLYAVWAEVEEPVEDTEEPVDEPEVTEPQEDNSAPKTGVQSGVLPSLLMFFFGTGIVAVEVYKKHRLAKE